MLWMNNKWKYQGNKCQMHIEVCTKVKKDIDDHKSQALHSKLEVCTFVLEEKLYKFLNIML